MVKLETTVMQEQGAGAGKFLTFALAESPYS
jgi:hypothetical protein